MWSGFCWHKWAFVDTVTKSLYTIKAKHFMTSWVTWLLKEVPALDNQLQSSWVQEFIWHGTEDVLFIQYIFIMFCLEAACVIYFTVFLF